MLDYYTFEGNQYVRKPYLFKEMQLVKLHYDNGGEHMEYRFMEKRVKLKDNMDAVLVKPENLVKVTVPIASMTSNTAGRNGRSITVYYLFDVDGKTFPYTNQVPLGVVLEFDKLYGFKKDKDNYVLNMPADKSVFRFLAYSTKINMPDFFVGSIDIPSVKILDDAAKNDGYNKETIYIRDFGDAYIYAGNVYQPTISLETSKDKKTKKLVWNNKWVETNLFININNRTTISLKETDKYFKSKVSKEALDIKYKQVLAKDTNRRFYNVILDAMKAFSIFSFPYDEAAKKTNIDDVKSLFDWTYEQTLKNKYQFHNTKRPEYSINSVFAVLLKVATVDVLKKLKSDEVIEVENTEENVCVLKALQRCLHDVCFDKKDENITMHDIFMKKGIDVNKFVYEKNDMKLNHIYLPIQKERKEMLYVGQYYCPEYKFPKADFRNMITVVANENIVEKYTFLNTTVYSKYETKDEAWLKRLIMNMKMDKTMSDCTAIIESPEDILPVYDAGENTSFSKFMNRSNNREEVLNMVTSTNISGLKDLFNNNNYCVILSEQSNQELSVYTDTKYCPKGSSLEYMFLEKVPNAFKRIGCADKEEMEKMLVLFTNFTQLKEFMSTK